MKRRTLWSWRSLLLSIPLAWSLNAAQDPVTDDQARALHAAVLEVASLADELRAEEARLANARTESASALDELEREVATSRSQVAHLRTELDAQHARRASARARTQAITADLAQTATRARAWAQALAARAQRGTPTTQDLGAELQALAERLASPQPQALAELAHRLGQALPTWRRAALTNRLVQLPDSDQLRHAWVVRIGAVGACFLTEDETLIGLAARQPGVRWVTFEAAAHPQLATHIRDLKRQLSGATSARLAPVPLLLESPPMEPVR